MLLGGRTTGGLVSVVITNGGTGYTAAPTATVGGGSGATMFCQLAGTAVGTVVIQTGGTGYSAASSLTFSGGGGTGAAGTAYGYTGSIRPMSFFKGRYADVYGVDGMGRGVRWDGSSTGISPIGVAAPHSPVAMTGYSSGVLGTIRSVQLVSSGQGYGTEPKVVFTGGSATRAAKARAILSNGRVTQIKVLDGGAGYQVTPKVSFSGGAGSGATFGVTVSGQIATVEIINPGSGYTDSATTAAPTLSFDTPRGLADAHVKFTVDQYGKLESAVILSAGTGATSTPTVSVSGGSGSGATVLIRMRYNVTGVNVSNGGSNYYAPPVVAFRAHTSDVRFIDAAATAYVNTTGAITGVDVYNGGEYSLPPKATILDTPAVAQADLRPPLRGTYKCAIRYLDSTPGTQGGPRASSISALAEIDAEAGYDSLVWTFNHGTVDSRVTAMELWRTTADQSVILFRVATINRTGGTWDAATYTDTLSDQDLSDPERDGYALMPITLPSGQVNARRFEIPPGEFAVGCMFQDRAWYAVDTTGNRPNTLLFSEVDEPESVPGINELVVQENTGDPDKIVGLIPLGTALLIAQQSHLYRLTYVAQPAIDASVMLIGYRGLLNSRCWDVMGGVAFIVDSVGMYAFDGNSEEALSVAVDDYWRDKKIDFSKADKFHVRADLTSRTVRFFYCQSGDTEPTRALCYCIATKAWWEETFATAVTASCPVVANGQRTVLAGYSSGAWQKNSSASTESISYSLRTGAFPLKTEQGNRAVGVIYDPTISDCTLNLRLHYNNSATPRVNAIASDRGSGFTTTLGSTSAQLNLKKSRSALGDATGFATANFAGRVTPESAGGDKAVAIAIDGAQTATDPIKVHGVLITGAG